MSSGTNCHLTLEPQVQGHERITHGKRIKNAVTSIGQRHATGNRLQPSRWQTRSHERVDGCCYECAAELAREGCGCCGSWQRRPMHDRLEEGVESVFWVRIRLENDWAWNELTRIMVKISRLHEAL